MTSRNSYESLSELEQKIVDLENENLKLKKKNNELEKKPNNDLKLLKNYLHKFYRDKLNGSDFTTFAHLIFMTAMENNIDMETLIFDLEKGILDINKFRKALTGNIYDFIVTKYRIFAERIKDIKVGSNGGMASVGKGEWLISLLSGINAETKTPNVITIKKGNGDVEYSDSKKEEIKWNGGKVSTEQSGKDVQEKFNKLIDITDKSWVPFREKDKKIYSIENINMYNAIYWEAIEGEKNSSLSNDDLKKRIIRKCFEKVFNKTNSFIMFNDDGKFQRFSNLEQAESYYIKNLDKVKSSNGFECRAKQTNPISLYCHVF